eukprot:6454788-Amphidinium_carterae.1
MPRWGANKQQTSGDAAGGAMSHAVDQIWDGAMRHVSGAAVDDTESQQLVVFHAAWRRPPLIPTQLHQLNLKRSRPGFECRHSWKRNGKGPRLSLRAMRAEMEAEKRHREALQAETERFRQKQVEVELLKLKVERGRLQREEVRTVATLMHVARRQQGALDAYLNEKMREVEEERRRSCTASCVKYVSESCSSSKRQLAGAQHVGAVSLFQEREGDKQETNDAHRKVKSIKKPAKEQDRGEAAQSGQKQPKALPKGEDKQH